MEFRFKNKDKMKKYLEWRANKKISDSEFHNCIEYIKETGKYIKETRGNKMFIREGASLELEIDNDLYEVWVSYDNIIKKEEQIMLIDFIYAYDDWVFSVL